MPAWFEVKKGKSGQFSFVLKASNGEVILQSETYKLKTSALRGIASVQKNAASDTRYVTKEAKNKKTYFVLRAGNNQVIGTSEMYESPKACTNGIASVKKNGGTTTIKDLTAA